MIICLPSDYVCISMQLAIDKQFYPIKFHPVIGVNMTNKLTCTGCNRSVTRSRQTAIVVMPNDFGIWQTMWKISCHLMEYLHTIVGRSIIDENILQIIIALTKKTTGTAFNTVLYLIYWNQNTDKWHHVGYLFLKRTTMG